LDVEKDNIEYLIKNMEKLKKTWKTVLEESKKNATENEITSKFDINRRLKDQKYAEDYFHLLFFNKIINSIKDGLNIDFNQFLQFALFLKFYGSLIIWTKMILFQRQYYW